MIDELNRIVNMQKYFHLIRCSAGWTAKEFAERLGVSRQAITNIESGRQKLAKSMYSKIRSVLDDEIKSSPLDTQMLYYILVFAVDHPDKYEERFKNYAISYANMTAPSILSGTCTRQEVSNDWVMYVNDYNTKRRTK